MHKTLILCDLLNCWKFRFIYIICLKEKHISTIHIANDTQKTPFFVAATRKTWQDFAGPNETNDHVISNSQQQKTQIANETNDHCIPKDKNVLKEIIVVDDGSRPPLRKIMSEQLLTGGPGVPKMKIVRHEHTLGLISAKKSGLKKGSIYGRCLPIWKPAIKFKANVGKCFRIWSIWGMGGWWLWQFVSVFCGSF